MFRGCSKGVPGVFRGVPGVFWVCSGVFRVLQTPKVHTRNTKPLAAVGFNRFDIAGNFSQFSGTFLVHEQQTCF